MPEFDLEQLESVGSLEASSPGTKAQVLALFEQTVPLHLEACRSAGASRNAEALRVAAHTIKGISASLGASRLGHAAVRIENAAAIARWEDFAVDFREMSVAAENALTQLQQWAASSK